VVKKRVVVVFLGHGGCRNAMGFGPDPSNDPSNDPSPGFTGSVGPAGGAPSGDGPGDDDGTGSPAGDFEVGGLIRMAEGGEPTAYTT
jgi:hypothetical protein